MEPSCGLLLRESSSRPAPLAEVRQATKSVVTPHSGGVEGGLVEGVRAADDVEPAERPHDRPDLSDDLVLGDGPMAAQAAVEARVLAVGTVVTHHPQPTGRHLDVEVLVRGGLALLDVGLGQRHPVDRDAALRVAALDAITA